MMPLWFQRLNRRERILLLAIGGAVFVILNLVVWSTLTGMAASTRAELAERKVTRKQQKIFMKERSMWANRDEWLKKNQPTLKSPVEASALLDQVKQVASTQNMVIENPAIGSGDATPNYQAVFASVETKSPWPPLVHFLYDVQQPESFVVFESVYLAIDPADPTMMKGKFKIARWFSPKG
ncbi:MAG: type II secretion system protein M [Verrucomicrobiota bacterium]|nr:type II secretion system protein M [Verrucomicrobiota bacterium]